MLFVPLGVNLTPMEAGAEDELPQPAKPKVRRAINPDSKTATVTRFTVPPDTREFRILPISSPGGIILYERCDYKLLKYSVVSYFGIKSLLWTILITCAWSFCTT